jgi:hypothetical protein
LHARSVLHRRAQSDDMLALGAAGEFFVNDPAAIDGDAAVLTK